MTKAANVILFMANEQRASLVQPNKTLKTLALPAVDEGAQHPEIR